MSGATSDGESRETDTRCGPGHLEDTGTQSNGYRHASTTELSTATAASCVCREIQRQTQRIGHSNDAGPGDATPVSAGFGPDCGNAAGPQLLWVSDSSPSPPSHAP